MNPFHSKKCIKIIASFLVVLLCITGIQFADFNNVKADDLDFSKAELVDKIYTNRILGESGGLFEFHPKESFQHRFDLQGPSKELIGKKNDQVIDIYDSSKKLIASSDNRSLSVYLEKDHTYYVKVEGETRGYLIYFRYDIDVSVLYRPSNTSSGEYKENTKISTTSVGGYSGVWLSYEIVKGNDVKIKIDLDNLPNSDKYTYTWCKYINGSFNPLSIKNKDLELAGSTISDFYACRIESNDGKFCFDYAFCLKTVPNVTFSDGSDHACTFKAFRPGETRFIEYPATVCDDYTGTPIYYLKDICSNNYLSGNDGPISAVPEDWAGSLFSCTLIHSGSGRKDLCYDMFYFVIGDGDGEKIDADKKIHIDAEVGEYKYAQLIYSFKPEFSGTYRFKTFDRQYGLPVVAIFDQDLNLMGFDNNENNFYNMYSEYDYPDLSDLDLTVKLDSNKTYYIAIPMTMSKLICDFEMCLVEKDPNQSQNTDPITDPDIVQSNDELSFDDFVERLYVVALNRQSEKDGKDYWCNLVGNGTLTGADCARFFLTSPEFKGRNLSDEDFLKVLYKTFFARDAQDDPDGFNVWMTSLKTVGKDTVVEGFINSPEWCNICADYGVKSGAPTAKATKASKNATAFATRLYTECLGREPEEGGLKYWSLGLTNCELSGSQAAHEFFYCQEFNDHNFDNKELLTRMYRTFMGREPDTDGLNYWLSNMNNGMTKDQVFSSFVQSQEFTEICANYAITR